MLSTNKKPSGDFYIIADHLRTTLFALADGAIFESKGRGYILKKLIKKVILLAYLQGINNNQLQDISTKLIEINSFYYSHLYAQKDQIVTGLNKEIEKQISFINNCNKKMDSYNSLNITAENIFFWYDTQGIPLELIRFYLGQKSHEFPEQEFNILLERQKERARQDRKDKKVSVF